MARKMLIDGEVSQPNEEEAHFDFDLFVIGAGSGGVRASRFSASYGAKVGICELPFHPISSEVIGGVGGTCVIRGCVPKKILVYGASFRGEIEDARNYGWEVSEKIDFNWKKLLHKKTEEIVRLNGIYKRLLNNAGVKLYEGEGKIVGPNEVEVTQLDGTKLSYTAKHILISTGSRATRPAIPVEELHNHSLPSFPHLSYLRIWKCPKLISLPLFPYLKKLVLSKCSYKPLEQTLRMEVINTATPKNLTSIAITSTSSSSTLATSSFIPLSKLKSMSIANMEETLSKELMCNLISLQDLTIDNCCGPLPLSRHLTALQNLTVSWSEKVDLTNDGDEMEWHGLQSLHYLRFY